MTDHFAARAAFLAALPKDDPERRTAQDHARACASCREALAEGVRLVALLQEALPAPPPTPEAMSRAALAIEAETGQERAAARRVSWAAVAGVAVAWIFQLMVGSGFVLDAQHAAVSLGVLAVAIAGVTLLRARAALALLAIVVTSGLLALLAGTASGFEAGVGIRCTFRELWAAVIPWAVYVVVSRRHQVPFGRWDLTVVAAAGALAAHAGQHLACKVPHAEGHLIVFHFSAVILAALLGGAVRAPARALPA
jgi:hypothetical protein